MFKALKEKVFNKQNNKLIPDAKEIESSISYESEFVDKFKYYGLLKESDVSIILPNKNYSFSWIDDKYVLEQNELGYINLPTIRYKEFVEQNFSGSSIGVSMRVGKGLHLRHTLFRGKAPKNTYYKGSTGMIYITNKNIYFNSKEKQFSKNYSFSSIKLIEKGDIEIDDGIEFQKFRLQPDENIKDSYYELEKSAFCIVETLFNRIKTGNTDTVYIITSNEYDAVIEIFNFINSELVKFSNFLKDMSDSDGYYQHYLDIGDSDILNKFSDTLLDLNSVFADKFFKDVFMPFQKFYFNEINNFLAKPNQETMDNAGKSMVSLSKDINQTMKLMQRI